MSVAKLRGGISGALLLAAAVSMAAAEGKHASYTPVAPPRALLTTLQINLKIAQEWVEGKDYVSAEQSAHGLIVLAQLYGYQSSQPEWQQRTKALAEASGRLLAAAKKKDHAGCEQALQAGLALLEQLAKHPPTGPKVTADRFASFGSTKTWMLLMDGAFVDAKSAKKPAEMADLAYTLAELLAVNSHLRNETSWQTMSSEARQAALAAAGHAAASKLDEARADLKNLYLKCESPHQGYKK